VGVKHLRGGATLADGLREPLLLELHVEEVLAQLLLAQVHRIGLEMLVEQPHLPVIGVAGAGAVVAQREKLRETLHRGIRMIVGHRVLVLLADGLDLGIVALPCGRALPRAARI
jgi:hypothetical protein